MFNPSLKLALLATTASLILVACGGGSTSSPGSAGPVTINPTTPTDPTPNANLVDLVPGDDCQAGTTRETTDVTVNGAVVGQVEACTITGVITSNLTLEAKNGYALEGAVFVGEDGSSNATLTIPAGTTIFGETGEDYLVITRGSRINARGTATDPIIMTSIQDVQGSVDAVNDRGLWGGLVINGDAPINRCIDGTATPGTAGCERSGEGSSGLYGGGNSAHNAGTLEYLQVKYAGNLINDSDELNGIAFQGVGSGTTCNHIQVHNNTDDGVEFFGGNVFCSELVLTGNGDDSLDWTDGWKGGAQRVLIIHTEGAGDQGIEADNRSSNNGATPISDPTISNFTFVGNDGDIGILAREGTQGQIVNGIIVDFPDAGIDVDNDLTLSNLQAGTLSFASIFLDNPTNILSGDSSETVDTRAIIAGSPNIVEGNSSLTDRFFPGSNEQAVPATDVSMEPGFMTYNYIGAFSDTETADSNWAQGWTFSVFESPTECPSGTLSTGDVVGGKQICSLTGTITQNTRLNNNFIYQLEGAVFIGEDQGGDPAAPIAGANPAILTIDAGTTLYGAAGEDYLVISRGSQIRSNGTRNNPVIMTSRDEVFGTADTANDRGKWGGLVINGRAPINRCIDGTATPGTTGCERSGEGSSGLYGGGTTDDNSGNLFYTRVSFAGNLINDSDELNGIAFQAVGSATQVDYVQVHNNVDDGVEFFGGNVNVKHLVLTGIGDDSLDWTDGWTGNVQYVIIDQANGVGDQGIEADNRSSNNDVLPRSNPTLSNLTFVGGDGGDIGILLREGTAGDIYNAVITDFDEAGFDIDNSATIAQATAGTIAFNSVLIAGNAEDLRNDGDGATPQQTALNNGANNQIGGAVTDFGARPVGGDRYAPGAPEQAVTATNVNAVDSFFDPVTYIGAVENENDDWYQGWTLLVDQ
ncbi:hypothetical protein GCM10007853_26510 [Algimonas ampicilliniresistens]|uniref:Lipoprotein n=1 Tax=Algimonas ampicilliniresistens TaxID=1298735 RepID=A0ABQ5VCH1_9PROT|nr:hypothetical protein [Algimonas ampicilliniresistens]GLQ24777.1 hypothetical protein GCM10007853_26510 [Algimonas ampicilliniresistens]